VGHGHELASVYAKLCAKTARVLLDKSNQSPGELKEAMNLLRESLAVESNNADNWYRLGSALLETGRVGEALDCLHKAEVLAPKKEYICHKVAQAYLKQEEPDEALKAYERIPQHRQALYILHGMAQCYMAKEEFMEAARKLHQAIRREPRKFYHHWDFALALSALGAKEQALEALEQTNQLFRQEHGKDYQKALTKFTEISATLPPGVRVSFDEPLSAKTGSSYGTITKYDARRGFGFIKDEADGVNVFFHITRVKDRTAPPVGTRVRYIHEVGEKGPQAAKVWLLNG
jgi:tetratricopeptide (TPR) repeat protein